jgi:hypothetical protein
VYIPPYEDQRAIPFINHFIWLLENIFEKDRHAKVLIGGDFNFHLKTIEPKLKNLGVHGIIPKDVATHTKGNRLDQIFSNG